MYIIDSPLGSLRNMNLIRFKIYALSTAVAVRFFYGDFGANDLESWAFIII